MAFQTLRNLTRRKGRTTLTILGVALAISLLVTMFSIGEGVRIYSKKSLDKTNIDLFVQAKGSEVLLPGSEFDDGRMLASAIKANPKVEFAFPFLSRDLLILNETMHARILAGENLSGDDLKKGVLPITVNGVIPRISMDVGGLEIKEGPGFLEMEDPFFANGTYAGGTNSTNFTGELMANSALSKYLKAGVGDLVYVYPSANRTNESLARWAANGTRMHLTGISEASFEGITEKAAYIHLSELQYLTNKKNDAVTRIYVSLYDSKDDVEVKKWIEEDIGLEAFTKKEFLSQLESFTSVYTGFADMIIAITFLVAVVFTGTIMMMSIRERVSEFGLMRAIGFSRSSIFVQILYESLTISILGLLIGLALGTLMAQGIDAYLLDISAQAESGLPRDFHFTAITWDLVFYASGAAVGTGVLCALGPGMWASSINITRVLREE